MPGDGPKSYMCLCKRRTIHSKRGAIKAQQ